MLQCSHMGPTPMMPWGRSLTAGQTLMWPPPPPPPPPAGYWPPPLLGGYWPPAPPVGHAGQSFSTHPPPSGQQARDTIRRRGHL
jgi:hypothetical protein